MDHLKSINPPWTLDTKKSVPEILNDNNIDISTIEAIIWSHHHFDHTGDPSTFPPSPALIVGPGVTKTILPGYPDNANSTLLASDSANRTLIELDFAPTSPPNPNPNKTPSSNPKFPTLQISNLPAIDYFADGSFYLLHTPGHAIGHICGLARATVGTNDKDSFILLAGDAFHHPGELRPSDWLTNPDTLNERYESIDLTSSPKDQSTSTYIDGHLFARLLPQAVLGEGECNGKGDGCLGLGSFYAPSGSCACHTGTLEKRCAANVEGGEEEEVTAK